MRCATGASIEMPGGVCIVVCRPPEPGSARFADPSSRLRNAHAAAALRGYDEGECVRYVVSGLLIVAGLIVGAIGILQQTVWAPEESITASASLSEPSPLLVIEPGVLNLYDTPATLTVQGEGELTLSQASKENIDIWVGETPHSRITGLADESTLAVETGGGEGETANPTNGDLFESQLSGEGEIVLDWDSEPARTAFLIASDGEAPAASSVEISWPNHAETPWALPLMIVGGILAALGLVLGFMDLRRAQKEKQRREARRERRRKLAETGAAFAIVPVIALAGCGGPAELPTPSPSEPPESAPAVVTDAQLERVIAEIADSVAASDEQLHADALAARAAGPFLEQRQSAYAVKEESEDYELPPAVAAESITVNFTSATDQWPRVTSAITSDSESGQSQLLVLSQENARADYRLWSQSVLLPGSAIPEVADARQGSQLLAPDQAGLKKTPEDTVRQYADVLQNGDDSRFAGDFAEDAFREQVERAQTSQREALAEGNGTIEFEYAPAEGNQLVAQQTADGGAIVTGLITVTTTIAPESVEGRTGSLTIPEPQRSIVGESTTSRKLVTQNLQVVSFTVPADGDAQLALIGVSDVLADAELAR